MYELFEKLLEATKKGLVKWKKVGEKVVVPGYTEGFQQYEAIIEEKRIKTFVQLKAVVKKKGLFNKRSVEEASWVFGVFLNDFALITSNEEALRSDIMVTSSFHELKMVDFFYSLEEAVREKDLLESIDADLTELLSLSIK